MIDEKPTIDLEVKDVGADGQPLKELLNPGKLPAHLRAMVKDWWIAKGEYQQIADLLSVAGYYIPKAALTIWADDKWAVEPEIEEFDPAFVAMTPSRQAVHLLWAKAVTAIRGISPHRAYAVNNICQMAQAIQKVASTEQVLDKMEQDKMKAGGDSQKILEAAKEQLMSEARKVLEQRPELLEHVNQICQVFESAEQNIKLIN